MMQSVRCRCFIALAALLTLFCGKVLGFAPNDYRRKTTITPASRPASIRAKIIPKKSHDGRNRWKNRSHRQKSSRLTSTYVEARHISNRFKSIQGIISVAAVSFKKCRKWLRSSTKAKRLIVGIILGAIIIFGPAFSPAHAASSVGSTTAFPVQSRALGQFNFLPSKAELEFSFRLVYAACSAALVGLERSCADRPAGLRTCCLVGLGACIYTISSVHGFLPYSLGYAPGSPMLEGVKCDPSRVAANIASGVGFIGAGMCIFVSNMCILSVLATFPDCIFPTETLPFSFFSTIILILSDEQEPSTSQRLTAKAKRFKSLQQALRQLQQYGFQQQCKKE